MTGGARGLGFEVVKVLLRCNMTVVIACRNVAAGKKAVEKLRASGISSGLTDVLPLDTASQSAVKEFVQMFRAKYEDLHLLINNGKTFVNFYLGLSCRSLSSKRCSKVVGCWTGLFN